MSGHWWIGERLHTRAPLLWFLLPLAAQEQQALSLRKDMRYTSETPVYEQHFDLAADPRKLRNLAGSTAHKDTLTKLQARCDVLKREAA